MSLNLKQKILISNFGITLGLLVVTALIIYPTVKNILSLRQDIATIENQLEERYEKTQKLKRSLKELSEIKNITSQMEQGLNKSGDELSIITTFEQLANQYQIDQNLNLSIVDESQQKNLAKNTARIFPHYYRLSFLNNGFFTNHLHYLSAIEKLPYYVIIENLNFEKRQVSKNGEIMPVTLRFDAIIYVENK